VPDLADRTVRTEELAGGECSPVWIPTAAVDRSLGPSNGTLVRAHSHIGQHGYSLATPKAIQRQESKQFTLVPCLAMQFSGAR
jgi:hypothetical protein